MKQIIELAAYREGSAYREKQKTMFVLPRQLASLFGRFFPTTSLELSLLSISLEAPEIA